MTEEAISAGKGRPPVCKITAERRIVPIEEDTHPFSHKGRVYFTLIELLIVISIIAILASLLLPGLNKAKETVKRTACASNIRSLLLSSNLYADDYHDCFPSYKKDAAGSDSLQNSWMCGVAEYLQIRNLNQLQKTAFACPSRKTTPSGYWRLHFMINPTAAPSKNEIYAAFAPNWTSFSPVYRRHIKKPSRTFLYTENKAGYGDTDAANPFVGGWHDITQGTTGMIHLNRGNWGLADGHSEPLNLAEAVRTLARSPANSQQMWE